MNKHWQEVLSREPDRRQVLNLPEKKLIWFNPCYLFYKQQNIILQKPKRVNDLLAVTY